MTIYYSPFYTGHVYIDLARRGGIAFNTEFVNTDGLVRLLTLRLGMHFAEVSQTERQAAYFKAMGAVMGRGENVLSASWEKNALGVSNECLVWRDALVACGWTKEMLQPSKRLELLAETEALFDVKGSSDRLVELLPRLKVENPLPADSEIFVAATSVDELPTVVGEILTLLQQGGTQLHFEKEEAKAAAGSNLQKIQDLIIKGEKNELADDDASLQIWDFPTALDAYRYIACDGNKADVYMCSDSKTLDNVQRMMGQPTSGSMMTNANPQISQLFKLGINLFGYPFNVRNLVSWLMMPNHPIDSKLRRSLARVIVSEGGVRNEKYVEAIAEYKKEQEEETGKNCDEKIDDMLRLFIPSPQKNGVERAELTTFLRALSGWAVQMAKVDDFGEVKKAQFAKVNGLCNAMVDVVAACGKDVMDFREVESWASSLYEASDIALYDSQAGSRWVVVPADIADEADCIVWTDCYNYVPSVQPTDFLNAHEQSVLTEAGCRFWQSDSFNLAMMKQAMRPVLMAGKQLVLVTAGLCKCEATAKHPLIIRLEDAYGDTLKRFVKHPENTAAETVEVAAVSNEHKGTQVKYRKKSLVAMPDHESYSSLHNLIQYPLDYFMEKVLRLHDRASYEMDAIETVKGNVAHAVIEKLFAGSVAEIESSLANRYDDVLNEMLEEKGALLMLKENIIEMKDFRQQLKENLEALLNIIRKNNLEVVATEKEVLLNVGLLNGEENDPPVKGFVDMLLKTKDGRMVVFDFKWTGSRSYHRHLLEENASIQLALYEKLVNLETGKPVAATAYYTMPWHKLYTTSDTIIDMRNVEHVEAVNDDNLLQKTINSYRYRRDEILGGTIATEEGYTVNEELDYVANTETQSLVPLEGYSGIHSENRFSNFKCFKGTLK